MTDRLMAEALILLARFIEAGDARCKIEAAVSYPEEYGGDAIVLTDAKAFFNRGEVRTFVKSLNKQPPRRKRS